MIQSPLIDIETLQELSSNHNLILLDSTIDKVTEKIDNDNIALIPNSVFLDIEKDFSDPNSGLPHTLIDETAFTERAQQLGINQDSILVIYDRWGIYSSPRAWWMFRYMGHQQTYVLDGGISAWQEAGLPTTNRHILPSKQGNFLAAVQPEWIVDKKMILNALDTKAMTIVDARGAGRFSGSTPEPRNSVRSGHIPTSSNLPFDLVLDGAYLKDIESLKALFQTHLSANKRNVFSCGSGITGSILALAAFQIGVTNISVYDGSWAEWGSDPQLPVA